MSILDRRRPSSISKLVKTTVYSNQISVLKKRETGPGFGPAPSLIHLNLPDTPFGDSQMRSCGQIEVILRHTRKQYKPTFCPF